MAALGQDNSSDSSSKQGLGEIDTDWPGVHYRLLVFKRVPPNRLLLLLQLVGTKDAPATGVMIDAAAPAIPGIKAHRSFFSFATSTMTDTLSKISYPVLPSIAPPGHMYRPNELMATIRMGRSALVNIQFACPPPPPPPPEGEPPKKQFLLFAFPKGKSPMKIELPPPDTAVSGAPPAAGGA